MMNYDRIKNMSVEDMADTQRERALREREES